MIISVSIPQSHFTLYYCCFAYFSRYVNAANANLAQKLPKTKDSMLLGPVRPRFQGLNMYDFYKGHNLGTCRKACVIYKQQSTMIYDLVLAEMESYIRHFFDEHQNDAYAFHNRAHMEEVVEAVEEIADFYKLAIEHRFILKSAAIFHDIAYVPDGPNGHEWKSARMAKEFLTPFSIPPHVTQSVENCIMATRNKQHPNTFLEAILCDADLLHLGKGNFEERNHNRYIEITNLRKRKVDYGVWLAISLNLLQQHQFYTPYVRTRYENGKQKNIKALKQKLQYGAV